MFKNGYAIRVGTGLSCNQFAVGIAPRQIDDPVNLLIHWTRHYRQPWFRADVPSEIYGLLPKRSHTDERLLYSALGGEGIIYHFGSFTLAEDIYSSSENLPERGNELLIMMRDLDVGRVVTGQAGRMFVFRGNWQPLTQPFPVPPDGNGAFEIAALEQGEIGYVAGGRQLPDNILSEVTKKAYEEDLDLWVKLLFDEVKPETGVFLFEADGSWKVVASPYGGNIRVLRRLSDGRIIFGTSGGVIGKVMNPDEIQELATVDPGVPIVEVEEADGLVIVASEGGLYQLVDSELSPFGSKIPDERGRVMAMSVVPGGIWVFLESSVGLTDGRNWEWVDFPEGLTALPFVGLV